MELVEKMTWENQARRKAREFLAEEDRRERRQAQAEAQRRQTERWSWFVTGGAGASMLAYLGIGELGNALGCLAVLLLAIGTAVSQRG